MPGSSADELPIHLQSGLRGSAQPRIALRVVAGLCLSAYLVALWLVLVGQVREPPNAFWDLQQNGVLLQWLKGLVLSGLRDLGLFAVIGLLLPLVVCHRHTPRGYVVRGLLSLLLAVSVTTLLRSVQQRAIPGFAEMVLPAAGCIVGTWIGLAIVRGRRAVAWLLPQLLLVVLLGLIAGWWLGSRLLASEPMPFEPVVVTTEEKRRVVNLLRRGYYHKDPGQGPLLRKLQLTQHDVDLLLAWGLSLGTGPHKAISRLQDGHFQLLSVTEWPVAGIGLRFVNLDFTGHMAVADGQLELDIKHLKVGHVDCPRWINRWVRRSIRGAINSDADARRALASIKSVRAGPGVVEIIHDKELGQLMMGLWTQPELRPAIRAQIRHLIEVGRQLPRGDHRFLITLAAAFEMAHRRSEKGDCQVENRAAIYALAILLGHDYVERLVGPVMDPKTRSAARSHLGLVTLRGRHDWTRHFWISAALALHSSEAASDAMGLLKEELDAQLGGSGFSFSDLMADRAGTMFALAATRDLEAARAMQTKVTGDLLIGDIFPPAADLPEGISDAELRSYYGGVGGHKYRRIELNIEERLDVCPALHASR